MDTLEWYMGKIRHPILTREQEATATQEELITHNLLLVVSIAGKYAKLPDTIMDLIQCGNLGLIRAAQDFDPSIGKFSTYASQWIRAEILLYFCDAFGKKLRSKRKFKDVVVNYEFEEDLEFLAEGLKTDLERFTDFNKASQVLTQKEKMILNMRLGGTEQTVIGDVLHVSHQRVEQIQRIIVAKMQKALT